MECELERDGGKRECLKRRKEKVAEMENGAGRVNKKKTELVRERKKSRNR